MAFSSDERDGYQLPMPARYSDSSSKTLRLGCRSSHDLSSPWLLRANIRRDLFPRGHSNNERMGRSVRRIALLGSQFRHGETRIKISKDFRAILRSSQGAQADLVHEGSKFEFLLHQCDQPTHISTFCGIHLVRSTTIFVFHPNVEGRTARKLGRARFGCHRGDC